MQRIRSGILVAAAIAVTTMLLPESLAAQDEVTFDVRGGVSVPAGDLSTFVDPSPGFTVGIDYPLADRVFLRFDGGADLFAGGEIDNALVEGEAPDLSVVRFTGGLGYRLLRPDDDSRLSADAHLGAGVGILTSERRSFSLPAGGVAIVDLSELYFAGQGGLLLGYRLADQVDVFVSGQAFLTLADEQDTDDLGLLTTEGAPETLWAFPVSAGLQFRFPR